MNLKSHTHVCVCVGVSMWLAPVRQGDILRLVQGYAKLKTHTHTCTHTHTSVFEILQYRGQGKQNTSPLHKYTHITCWQGLAAKFIMSAISHCLPNPAFQSKLLYRQTLWLQPFHGKSGKREGKV